MTAVQHALKVITDYADQLTAADASADRGTMMVADQLAALYESKAWVAEWLEQKPQPHRPPNNWTADSRSRFAQWVNWRLERDYGKTLNGVYTYRLLDAHQIASAFARGKSRTVASERTIRPFKWLLKHRYSDRIPDVWDRAVTLAGSADAVTSAHTRQALAEWKRDVLGSRGVAKALKAAKAETIRSKATLYFDQLAALASENQKAKDELVAFMEHIDKVLEAAQ